MGKVLDGDLVIVGAGHAGGELAVSARQGGWTGAITLLGDEPSLPYHRPPLSKGYLTGHAAIDDIHLRPSSTYEAARIVRRPGARVVAIDRDSKHVELADGSRLPYGKLALCLGGRPRPLECEGIEGESPPSNLFYLRDLKDADRLRPQLLPGRHIVIVGGGYVGLEVAASARARGADVTVLEMQSRLLARVAGPEMSRFYELTHRSNGVDVRTGTSIKKLVRSGDAIAEVVCADGSCLRADAVVAGIGMLPNVELGVSVGLGTVEGLTVDENGATADPDIFAAGDCTRFWHPLYERHVRIESVPNALDQARAIAGWLCGKPKPNRAVPWFWSDQYDLKLQISGLSGGYDRCVARGDPALNSFCVFYLSGSRLLSVDSVNRPAEFMATRKALTRVLMVDAERLADEAVPLKEQFV